MYHSCPLPPHHLGYYYFWGILALMVFGERSQCISPVAQGAHGSISCWEFMHTAPGVCKGEWERTRCPVACKLQAKPGRSEPQSWILGYRRSIQTEGVWVTPIRSRDTAQLPLACLHPWTHGPQHLSFVSPHIASGSYGSEDKRAFPSLDF